MFLSSKSRIIMISEDMYTEDCSNDAETDLITE